MARRNMLRDVNDNVSPEERKRMTKNFLLKLLVLVAVTAAVLIVYRFFMERPEFYIVFAVYAVIAAASVVGYVIYNRGFSRKGITEDMLPQTWSDEEKAKFIEDGKRRAKRSRWLLVVAFAFIFTFAFDAFDLFVIQGLFGL